MNTSDILLRFKEIQFRIAEAATNSGRTPEEITLIAVSKNQSQEILDDTFKNGIHIFGESYAQELRSKAEFFKILLKPDEPQPEWNFIGHLQTNKVKYVTPYASMIHSVDSLRLAEEISKQAAKANRTIDILIQPNTSGEASKFGCPISDVPALAESIVKLPNIHFAGLMTIPADDESSAKREFSLLRELRDKLRQTFGTQYFQHLSMGMTHDFEIAIAEGATIVRIGTAIFGERPK